jgi:hypothetical protein
MKIVYPSTTFLTLHVLHYILSYLYCQPANHLRPDSITHQYSDIMNPWSKVKTGGNRPRKSSLGIELISLLIPSGSWERLLVVLWTGRDTHTMECPVTPPVRCIGRGEDAIPHRLALLYSV